MDKIEVILNIPMGNFSVEITVADKYNVVLS